MLRFTLTLVMGIALYATLIDSSQRLYAQAGNNWWQISDEDFVKQYGNLATGSQMDQSKFAWMLFARVNQQVPFGNPQQKFSQWELWASNLDTFSPNAPPFDAAKKIRTRPHLEPIQQIRGFVHAKARVVDANPFPTVGEEVTRNPISYNYIMSKQLNTRTGVDAFLSVSTNVADFPLGAVETKAVWVRGARAGAQQFAGLSLTALHLMVKIKPTPNNPFTDNAPSWFWTTFELNSNPDLAAARKFITYPNLFPSAQVTTLLTDAGIASTSFVNYSPNGQQTQFNDAQHSSIILGNTQLEAFLATPPSTPPNQWTSWSTSCHSCHAQSSGKLAGSTVDFFNFTGPVGPLTGSDLPSAGYRSFDFVWSIPFHAR